MYYAYLLVTCLDIALCVDLYFTLRNSFGVPANRTRFYYAFTFIYSTVGILLIRDNNYTQDCPHVMTITLLLKAFYFLIVIPIIVYTLYKLSKPGLSRQYKSLLAKRHLTYVCLVTLC